jgi:multiple sugar transport system substrate-binding protein
MTERRDRGRSLLAGRTMSRWDFLRVGGAGLAGVALLGTAGCGGSSSSGNLVFSMGADSTKTLPKLIDKFNKQNHGFKVTYRVMPTDTGQYFDKLQTEFQAGQSDIDVIGGDVIWGAQFAANKWTLDISDKFPESERSKFLPAPIQSVAYEGKYYGVPWYTDAGMLYYRKDLLQKSGFSAPPKTWDELKSMAEKVTQQTGTPDGFVFQGSNYEGGVCNALEYIWNAGGDVLQGNKVVIDSSQSAAGLAEQHSMITSGVAPKGVSTYTETETDPAFMGGKSVFARNWPYMYSEAGTSTYPKVKPDMVGVAPIPVSSSGDQSYSCLGGWNMYISALSDKQDQAWTFVKWITAPEQMKWRALNATLLPARTALYNDKEILNKVPVIRLGKDIINNTKPRPVSPYYSDMSLKMQEQFNLSLKGDVSPQQAVKTLQKALTSIQQQAS